MKEKEVESIKTYYFVGVVYNPKLTYLKYRNMLLSWVDNACVSFGYPITVKGLTAELLDRIFSKIKVSKNRMHVFTVSCFLIAAKFEVLSDNIPSFEEICNCLNSDEYSPQLFKESEILILSKLNWNIYCVTTSHFLLYLKTRSLIIVGEPTEKGKITEREIELFNKLILFFDNYVSIDFSFKQFLPSMLACSIIISSRKTLGLLEVWKTEFRDIFQIEYLEINQITNKLWTSYNESHCDCTSDSPVSIKQIK